MQECFCNKSRRPVFSFFLDQRLFFGLFLYFTPMPFTIGASSWNGFRIELIEYSPYEGRNRVIEKVPRPFNLEIRLFLKKVQITKSFSKGFWYCYDILPKLSFKTFSLKRHQLRNFGDAIFSIFLQLRYSHLFNLRNLRFRR